MGKPLRVLLCEDSEDDERVETAEAMRAALAERSWDIVLSDYNMPSFYAPEALEIHREMIPDVPFVVVSGAVGEETAAALMRAGAADYVMKTNLARLPHVVGRELRQAEIRRVQKLQSLGRLAGGIAHDLNNMLGPIIGYTEMTLDNIQPGDPLRDHLKVVLAAAERAKNLTQQLLAVGRKQTLQPRVLDLNQFLAEFEKTFRRLIGEDIQIEIARDPELASVKADPACYQQVMLDLVLNARDAMASGGKITIRTTNETVGEDLAERHPGAHPGPYVVLSVSDTGCAG